MPLSRLALSLVLALLAASCGENRSVNASNAPFAIDGELELADMSAATAIASTADGILYVAGWAQNNNQPARWVVRRWNHLEWKTIDDWSVDRDHAPTPVGIAIASDGAVYVGGSIESDGWDRTWLVRKWDGQRWTESDRYQGASNSSWLTSIAADTAGHIYAIGYDVQFNPDDSSDGYNIVRASSDAGWNEAARVLEREGERAAWMQSAVNAQGELFGASGMGVSTLLSAQFNAPLPWSSSDSYVEGQPGAMAFDATGHIFIATVLLSSPSPDEWRQVATLLAWNGAAWTTIDSVAADDNTEYTALTIDSDGVVFAGGNIDASNGNWFIRKWNGQTMTAVSSSASPVPWSYLGALASDLQGHVYAAGAVSHDLQTEHWIVRRVQ
jgi:hypothetical protein